MVLDSQLSMTHNVIRDIANFIIEHNKYIEEEKVRKYVEQHSKYGTIDYAVDRDGNIVAVCRWNVKNNVFEVLDFCIREDFRNGTIGKDFILRGLKKFPNVEYLEYTRGVRGDSRKKRINVEFILKRNIF
jgi:hypothetical protein